jgi:hypothetical protein
MSPCSDSLAATRGLSDHPGVRASTLVIACSLLTLACVKAPESATQESRAAAVASKDDPRVPEAAPASSPEAPPSHEPGPEVAEAPVEAAAPIAEPEPQPPAEPADPLAPILPSGPEPGSPEADAELAELLEESTLTQAEFDAAFRSNKPKFDGDQLVFGPGDRKRKRPIVKIGRAAVSGAKLTGAKVTKLAEADQKAMEGCLAVALTDDPQTAGEVTLVVTFETGEPSAKLEGGASLGEPLRACLVTVADGWDLTAPAGARVTVPLTLTSE